MTAPNESSNPPPDLAHVRALLEQRGWLPPEEAKKLRADLVAAKQIAVRQANEIRRLAEIVKKCAS
jgi:hypothetical protein